MKKIIVALLLVIQSAVVWAGSREPVRTGAVVEAAPREDCTGQIVQEIGAAKEEILVQAYACHW